MPDSSLGYGAPMSLEIPSWFEGFRKIAGV